MKFYVLLLSVFIIVVIESRSLDGKNFETRNEIEDYDNAKRTKATTVRRRKIEKAGSSYNLARRGENSDDRRENDLTVEDERADVVETTTTIKPEQQTSNSPNVLLQLLNRLQFAPQLFFQDRLNQLKESLGNLGFSLSSNNGTASKQFASTNSILQLVGLNDSGFYTDRLEPAGFLGGNGWFANKGGILGGPGAIISTGSLLTDYPTAYKK